jgi:peptide deformylase
MSEISKLIEPNNPALRVRLNEVTEKCDREKIVKDLTDSMEHYQGIGLSANQIGIMERVFIMYEDINTRKILACFNPRIIEMSKEQVSIDEGCLSYPGIWLKIKRPYAIKVEFENEKGEKQEREFIDLPSRVFQHEYDHMEGTDFTRLASPLKLERAIKKLNKKLRQHRKSK